MTEPHATESGRVVRDFVAWQNGDDAKLPIVSESIDVYNPGLPEGEAHRREELVAYLHESQAAFRNLEFTIEEMVTGESVALAELSVTGTHAGEFKGIPATGRDVEFGAMAKYIVADGRMEEIHVYYDTQELAGQLGLTFPAVLGQLPKLAPRKVRERCENRRQ